MQTTCSPKSSSLLCSRTHWWYTASKQRTRLIRSATVRITVYFLSVFVAHSTQNRFSHLFPYRFSSTRRHQRPISTLLRPRGHYSYTHTAAPHSYCTSTRTALTSLCTRRQTARLPLYTCAWTGGLLSGVLALGTGQPCPAGRWVLSHGCYSARLANTSVEVSRTLLSFFWLLQNADEKQSPDA
jgi:hypothetical protein